MPYYCHDLRAELETDVNDAPRAAVHSKEWQKIMDGEPVEINPSYGHGVSGAANPATDGRTGLTGGRRRADENHDGGRVVPVLEAER